MKNSTQQENGTEWHIQRILTVVILLLLIILLLYFFSDRVLEQESNGSIVDNEGKKDIKTEVKDDSIKVKKDQPAIQINQPINNIKPVEYKIADEKQILELYSSLEEYNDQRIARALLTSGLINKEPIDIIDSPITVNKNEATELHYVTEILNMKGQFLFHHWLWNDTVIFRRKINILGNRWRASTSKLIHYTKSGFWKVRLINNEDNILNEIQFNVVKE